MNEILDTNLMHPSDQIVLIISRIYRRGMTTCTGGNISVIDEGGNIWITPSAIDKGSLKPSDIMCVKPDGTITGPHRPSSELPFHKAIYEMRPDIKAIIHAHPPALVSFSIVRETPDTSIIGNTELTCGAIGYAGYELPGSEALGKKIAEEFRKGVMAVIMENHGTVLGGSDMNDAYSRFETFEFCARTILYGKTIGNPHYLTNDQIKNYRSILPPELPEMNKISYPSEEMEKRNEICRMVHRACEQDLMISSAGTISMRWHGNDFLITPSNISRWNLRPDDIVQIKDGMREPGKTPSRSAWLHQEIYKRNPSVNSIIITQSPYLMAFSVTHTHFNVRTIPESWIFLQDVPLLPFETHFHGEMEVVKKISANMPAVIIENDSFIVTGDRLIQTFDRLEVAEFSAKSLVMAKPIGSLVPINDAQVEDLRKVFLKK